jgi:hypothetical protein
MEARSATGHGTSAGTSETEPRKYFGIGINAMEPGALRHEA